MPTATATPPSKPAKADKQEKEQWQIPDSDMNLEQFITAHNEAITALMKENYPPQYLRSNDTTPLPRLLRRPMGRQQEIIRGAAFSLRRNRGTVIVGEMGVGKTYIAVAACKMAGFKSVIVICPTHLTRKWKREVEETLGPRQADAVIASSITDLRRIQREYGGREKDSGKILFVIMSKEMAKGTYQWKPDYHHKLPLVSGKLITGEDGQPFLKPGAAGDIYREDGTINPTKAWRQLERFPACRQCDHLLMQKEEQEGIAGRKRAYCTRCKAPLWTAASRNLPPICRHCKEPADAETAANSQCRRCHRPMLTPAYRRTTQPPPAGSKRPGPRKIALSEYIRKKMPHFFQLVVTDEVHQYKEQDSAQGINVGNLAQHCGRTLALTGTLMGGYSSNTFHLLYRFSPDFRGQFPYDGLSQWKKEYGLSDEITVWKEEDDGFKYHGRTSKRRIGRPRRKEKPGISPSALFHIIGNTLFLRLQDVSSDLPPFHEIVTEIELDREPDDSGFSQHSAYMVLQSDLKNAVAQSLAQGSHSLLGIYINSLLAYADGCYKGETAIHPYEGDVLAQVPPLRYDKVYPKERELIRIVREERQAARKTLVYASHTDTRDITPRLRELLEAEGLKTAVMKSGNPSAEKREEWIKNRVNEGIDVLICNPGLVETGMDLFAFPTIVWMQPEYNVYTMRQASRRSWRIGQQQPVKVYYLIYYETAQRQALQLIASKTQVSLSVEGELPSGGILSLAGQDDNLVTTLARNIAGQTPDEEPDWENAMLAGRKAEHDAEALLSDEEDGWQDTHEPEEPEAAPPPAIAGTPAVLNLPRVNRGNPAKDPHQMSLFEFLQ